MSAGGGQTDVSLLRIDASDGSSIMRVHVSPGARRPGIGGIHGDALKVAVSSPPEDGKANKALIGLLVKALGLRRSDAEIVGGQTSRQKRVLVSGIAPDRLREMIAGLVADQ